MEWTCTRGFGAISFKRLSPKKHAQEQQVTTPREWPSEPSGYQLLEECGRGAYATVYRALCVPLNEEVAIKKMDLDSSWDLASLVKEVHLMKTFNHPNILQLHASFVTQHELWMVMPYLDVGSVRSIMKRDYPQGLEEPVIATIMKEVLKGLEYVHKNGGIHRDVKGDNILLAGDGSIMLADFGVAAFNKMNGSIINYQHIMHSTFVGTPCWMAPEVLQQDNGYDSSADIWSFGITLLELARGRPPLAKCNPMRVVLSIMQNPAPGLDEDSKEKHFSKNMHEVVSWCLQKDAARRPTATQLLQHRFFKQAKDKDHLVYHFLMGLSPRQETPSPRAAPAAKELLAAKAQEVLGGRAKSAWYFDRYSVDSDKGDRQQQETVEEGHEEEEEEGQEHHHQQQQQNQQQNQQQQQQPQDTATDKLSVPLQQPPDQQPDVDAFVLFSTRPRLLPSWR
eukprot:jgi/Chrzof1/733/Cz01g26210.t1